MGARIIIYMNIKRNHKNEFNQATKCTDNEDCIIHVLHTKRSFH